MGQSSVLMILCVTVVVLSGFDQIGICSGEEGDNVIRMKLGGVRDAANRWNSAEIEALARFAVREHNRQENAFLELARVLKAKEQIVAGKLYHLTLEVLEAGAKKVYEAKVWVKPWMNFKQLQEFKHSINNVVSSDLGLKLDGNGFEWRIVPTNDPEVQDAANHAVKSIQQRSNSLDRYKLLEIILAKAKILGEHVKYELLLKLERGNKLENLMVEVTKNHDGKFY